MANPVKFQANAVDDEGNVLPNAQISVVGVVSGLPVSLFSDFDLSTGISNPFNAEADGSFEFYCENERANLIVIKDGFSRTWNDLFLKNDGAWATADNSNDSSFSTGWYVTPQGYKARYDHQLTQPHNWSGTQDFATVNIDDAIIDTVSGINNASGSLQVNGQAAFNGPLSIKDLTTATAPRSLINLNGDLQWAGNNITTDDDLGNAAFVDLDSPEATAEKDRVISVASNSVLEIGFSSDRRGGFLSYASESEPSNSFPQGQYSLFAFLDFGSSPLGTTPIYIGADMNIINSGNGNIPVVGDGVDTELTIDIGGTSGKIYLINRTGGTKTGVINLA